MPPVSKSLTTDSIDAFAAQSTNDRKAIEFLQPAVDDDYVIFAGDCMREPVFTIGR